MQRPSISAVLLVTALSVASCSSEPSSAPDPRPAPGPARTDTTPRIDLDPERYVLDYEETRSGATPGAANPGASTTASDGGAAAPPPVLPPTINEDNTFVDPGRNLVVDTGEQPTSTFGLDVDTGSFSVGRTFLTDGRLPPADSIRTEEWVNALGSDQVPPTTGDLGLGGWCLSLRLVRFAMLWGSG